jgi:hypothetical protein
MDWHSFNPDTWQPDVFAEALGRAQILCAIVAVPLTFLVARIRKRAATLFDLLCNVLALAALPTGFAGIIYAAYPALLPKTLKESNEIRQQLAFAGVALIGVTIQGLFRDSQAPPLAPKPEPPPTPPPPPPQQIVYVPTPPKPRSFFGKVFRVLMVFWLVAGLIMLLFVVFASIDSAVNH